MHVIATAGHVDHGKSTLVRALTGADPDRLPAEHDRGLSIELGYCWVELEGVGDVAFVDVPGHERFLATTLAGMGPVPAVLFVVAADDPWMPQSAEHLAALDALGVRHAVVAVTRSDLADPTEAAERTRRELAGTTLGGAPVIHVSGATGQGLDELRDALARMCATLPTPDPQADVRLWVDRRFHVRGAGTVVTGTLPAGRIRTGDTLAVGTDRLRVRGLESLGRTADEVTGVARVAINVGGNPPGDLARGAAIVSPGAWLPTRTADVRLRTAAFSPTSRGPAGSAAGGGAVPRQAVLHIGSAAVPVRVRTLDDRHVRLSLAEPVPLRIGDRTLLRDPGSRRLWGALILDPLPPPLRRRGAARHRAAELVEVLADGSATSDVPGELRRRGIVRAATLRQLGVEVSEPDRRSEWLLDPGHAQQLRVRLRELVDEYDRLHPLEPGLPTATAVQALRLPDPALVRRLVCPPLQQAAGRIHAGARPALPAGVARAVEQLSAELRDHPFAAPDANRLAELGLDRSALAAAAKSGSLLRLADSIVLLPGADRTAAARLAALPQPFTLSQARSALATTRRVAVPLLEHLDRAGLTVRHPDDRRSVR